MRTAEAPIRLTLFLLPGAMLLSGFIQSTTDISDRYSFVDFSFQGLQPLEGGLIYQAWAVTNRFGPYQGAPFLLATPTGGGGGDGVGGIWFMDPSGPNAAPGP